MASAGFFKTALVLTGHDGYRRKNSDVIVFSAEKYGHYREGLSYRYLIK
ncbi:hypothetical protein BCF53_10485 [Reinekea marinisedimentorum]|uniref:Uncharacterized protein n=1 Tax=Reinekea marinisedimentorum TaxID=230495 RepID=A0A4R3I836_9GAMM|nr:hypothetical protein BCF53_10485 [Reinekea marinisedimentorum]